MLAHVCAIPRFPDLDGENADPLPDNLRDLAALILDVIARMPAPAGEPPAQQAFETLSIAPFQECG